MNNGSNEAAFTVSVGETTFQVSAYHASHIAGSLLKGEAGWEAAAVECARQNMKHRDALGGYDGDFKAAEDAREIAKAHRALAVALFHAADDGNSHYLCDPATCPKQRERIRRLAETKPSE